MLRAHRQAWCWQDEYHGLTMDDIRRLERETQLHLAVKMAASKAAADGEGGEATPVATTPTNSAAAVALPAKQAPRGENAVHFVEQGASSGGEGGSAENAGEAKGYSRSVSRDSRSSSTSTLVNGGKGGRQSRSRASGETACLSVMVMFLLVIFFLFFFYMFL